jgi:hypothetical protein
MAGIEPFFTEQHIMHQGATATVVADDGALVDEGLHGVRLFEGRNGDKTGR